MIYLHIIALSASLVSIQAFAQDTQIRPGIQYRFLGKQENKRIHVLEIDLTRPEISTRASTSQERGLVPTAFAAKTNSLVAVNGGYFGGAWVPMGLAIGLGKVWSDSADTDNWSFLACTANNKCIIDTRNTAQTPDPSWVSAVDGWQVLAKEGFTWSHEDDVRCGDFCLTPHPRTAVGLNADSTTMWLAVVEGRQDNLTGYPLENMANLMRNLGASTALNLDGGGSSALVANGWLMNRRPSNEPQERRVANCFGIVWQEP